MTGTPISSKQALVDPSGGGIHSDVVLTSLSSISIERLFFQYSMGDVIRHPLPEIGL